MAFEGWDVKENFEEWLSRAEPGGRLAYWIGNLASEREQNASADAVARLAWAAYESGLILLSQKRQEPEIYCYLATRTSEGHI